MKERCARVVRDDDGIRECLEMGVWMYMPGNHSYCDEHVPRGCSCNFDPNTGMEVRDEQGRLIPCCEYEYVEDGWDEDGL